MPFIAGLPMKIATHELHNALIDHTVVSLRTRRGRTGGGGMVKTVPPDRADQPLHVSVLPWRARWDRSVSNAHSPNTPNEGFPIGRIAVANKVSRRILPTERFGQLLGDPLGARIGLLPPATEVRGAHAVGSKARRASETTPSARQTCPLRRCRPRDCGGRSSSLVTAAVFSLPCTWPRWFGRH